jgi:nucleotide-binding universal stress UspA family protein
MTERILVAVDFSAWGRAAMTAGLRLVKGLGADVVLVHAIEPFLPSESNHPDVQKQLEEAKAAIRADEAIALTTEWAQKFRDEDVDVVPVVEESDAADLILATAKKHKVAYIVVGTHGRTGLKRLLVGSVADAVIRGSNVPVVVVSPRK